MEHGARQSAHGRLGAGRRGGAEAAASPAGGIAPPRHGDLYEVGELAARGMSCDGQRANRQLCHRHRCFHVGGRRSAGHAHGFESLGSGVVRRVYRHALDEHALCGRGTVADRRRRTAQCGVPDPSGRTRCVRSRAIGAAGLHRLAGSDRARNAERVCAKDEGPGLLYRDGQGDRGADRDGFGFDGGDGLHGDGLHRARRGTLGNFVRLLDQQHAA